MSYMLEDLATAQEELDRWQRAWENYPGNNPKKFDAQLRASRDRVALLQKQLKEAGVLPWTDQELIERELDRAFPRARHNEIVEWNGERYQRKFTPVLSNRRRVKSWSGTWIKLEPSSAAAPTRTRV